MSGVVRACLLVGAAAKLSLILELHTQTAPHVPKLTAGLRNKVANISGLNSTDISVEKLPGEYHFPCPEILSPAESTSETAVMARQLRGASFGLDVPDSLGEQGFLGYPHGRKGHHHETMSSFPILLEVRGVTGGKLLKDLRAHAADLSATGCEAAGHPCKVTFALYNCRAHEEHHHRHHRYHHMPHFAGFIMLIAQFCCCLAVMMRAIRICCCGGRRCAGEGAAAVPALPALPTVQVPFLHSTAQAAPVRIVNGVILPYDAPSAGPALPAAPAPSAPAAQVQPAGVYPAVPAAPTYVPPVPMSQPAPVPMSQPAPDADLTRALALSVEAEESAQMNRAVANSLAESAARFCPACGAASPEGHRFCSGCGQPLQPGASPAAGLQL